MSKMQLFQQRDFPTYVDIAAEVGVVPTALTTEGGRSVLERISEMGDIPDLDDDEYLTMHGARRGLGRFLYANHGVERAQWTLRHSDPKITSEAYAGVDMEELAGENTEAFDSK